MQSAGSPPRDSAPLFCAALVLGLAYLLTGVIGIWAAYDPVAAWLRFRLVVVGVTAMMIAAWLGRRHGERSLLLFSVACSFLAGTLGGYFMLTHDWAHAGEKMLLFDATGLWLQAHRPHIAVWKDLHPNVTAGALAVLLPLGAAAPVWAWRHGRRALVPVLGLALLPGAVALLLCACRGAWLGLAAASVIVAHLERRPSRSPAGRRLSDAIVGAAVLATLVGWGLLVVAPQQSVGWLAAVPGGTTALSRRACWRDALVLLEDYPFTGAGLSGTKMVLASYVRLLQVPLLPHAHNLFLQIAAEQGLPGLVIFVGLLLVAMRSLWLARREPQAQPAFRIGFAVSLLTLIFHGLVDAGVYYMPTIPICFLPLGGAMALAPAMKWSSLRLALVATIILSAVLLLLPAGRGELQANLGTIAQTRAELSVYRWPEWPVQDALRRSVAVNLMPAISHYDKALALDPDNVTANRRLGQILLSLGDYDAARRHLEAAYARAPLQQPIRQLLGETYAVSGDIAGAVRLWRSIDVSEGQLDLRRQWYEIIGDEQRAARIRAATAATEQATGASRPIPASP